MEICLTDTGVGTSVRLRFPRSLGTAMRPQPQWVLVAEDDDIVRMLIVDPLGERGCIASKIVNGDEALTLLYQAAGFDLLLSDVGLPGADGRQVADYARARLADIKVLLMTG